MADLIANLLILFNSFLVTTHSIALSKGILRNLQDPFIYFFFTKKFRDFIAYEFGLLLTFLGLAQGRLSNSGVRQSWRNRGRRRRPFITSSGREPSYAKSLL